jgi:hypothetical protein
LDPTQVAFGSHLRLGTGAELIGVTPEGWDLIDLLHLNKNPALKVRQHFLRLLTLKERHPDDPDVEKLFSAAFGFPEDMPDLRKKRPPGDNTMPGSEKSCYFARRERKELPPTY